MEIRLGVVVGSGDDVTTQSRWTNFGQWEKNRDDTKENKRRRKSKEENGKGL
jgi:hypothetical protein